MICPKCASTNVQPITDDRERLYCVDCNFAWKNINGVAEPKGTLSFDGVPKAQELFKILTKGQEFTPEFRSALESQLVAMLLDQWFDGFKGGQMASILYARGSYGKNRNECTGTVEAGKERTGGANKIGKSREIRRREDPANPRASENSPTITERVNGGTITYPRHLKLPGNMCGAIAQMIAGAPSWVSNKYHWDGSKVIVEVDWENS